MMSGSAVIDDHYALSYIRDLMIAVRLFKYIFQS